MPNNGEPVTPAAATDANATASQSQHRNQYLQTQRSRYQRKSNPTLKV